MRASFVLLAALLSSCAEKPPPGPAPSTLPPMHGVTERHVSDVAAAAHAWRDRHKEGCPAIGDLVSDGLLAKDADVTDDWGRAITIGCSEQSMRVASAGPDGKDGTADDVEILVVPPPVFLQPPPPSSDEALPPPAAPAPAASAQVEAEHLRITFMSRARACYERALRANPNLTVSPRIDMVNGCPKLVLDLDAGVPADFRACLDDAVRSLGCLSR